MAETYMCTHSDLREEQFGDRFAFTCNGCRELGYDTCYTCLNYSCHYHLHSACKNAPPTMIHPFFNQGQFVLDKTMLPQPPYSNNPNPPNNHQALANLLCVACGTSVAHGWRYMLMINDVQTNVFLHPCCMTLPHQNLHTKLEKHINCMHCQSNDVVMGWAYVNNGAAVHVKCMKDMLHKDWEQRYNNAPNNGHTSTQERGLGGRERYAPGARRRKRDILFSGLNKLLSILGFKNDLGIIDWDSIKVVILDFARDIWSN